MSLREQYAGPHPYLPSGWGPIARAGDAVPTLPDINPAQTIVMRMRSRLQEAIDTGGSGAAAAGSDGGSGADGLFGDPGVVGPPGNPGSNGTNGSSSAYLSSQITQLQTDLAALTAKVNGATISAECSGDGTLTVTLTWGGS